MEFYSCVALYIYKLSLFDVNIDYKEMYLQMYTLDCHHRLPTRTISATHLKTRTHVGMYMPIEYRDTQEQTLLIEQ
jgi:hypothetical protein